MAIVRAKPRIQDEAGAHPAAATSLASLRAQLPKSLLGRAPIDVEMVARTLGIVVRREQMEDDMSGFLERQGQQWIAGVNAYHHPVRQRFTIAHEIAHFVLHRGDQARFDDVTFARRNAGPSKMEREADRFAAELLMPEECVISSLQRGERSLNVLAAEFGVSTLAMKFRLKELGYTLT